jgi:hypothetical protein
MGHIIVKLYPDGRVEQSLQARSWKEREQLLAYGLYLQPGLAALDVGARIWCDMRRTQLAQRSPNAMEVGGR